MYTIALCKYFFFFKQKTAYEMRISDWSPDVCSSDLETATARRLSADRTAKLWVGDATGDPAARDCAARSRTRLLHGGYAGRGPWSQGDELERDTRDRKSTRLNSSH